MSNVVYIDFASRRAVAREPAIVADSPLPAVETRSVAAERRASFENETEAKRTFRHEPVPVQSAEGLNRAIVDRARQAAGQLNAVKDDAEDLAHCTHRMRDETQNLAAAIAQLGEAIKCLEDLPRQARALVEAAS